MAKKKKLEPTEAAPEVAAEAAPEADTCGHENRHYLKSRLTCELFKGHAGDHSALLDGAPTYWTDAAGSPVARTHG